MTCERTDSGKINKYLFYDKPLVWVEGRTDITFYKKMLGDGVCYFDRAEGKTECIKLAKALVLDDLPYVVVLDGDYDILTKRRSNHRRVVWLSRYSFENYLFEEEAILEVCKSYLGGDSITTDFDGKLKQFISDIQTYIYELVCLDVAHVKCATGKCVLPNTDALFIAGSGITFNQIYIEKLCNEAREDIQDSFTNSWSSLVDNSLSHKRLVDIIRGEIAFGMIRRIIVFLVKAETGKKPQIDNAALRLLLILSVWGGIYKSKNDHCRLRRRLQFAIGDAKNKI